MGDAKNKYSSFSRWIGIRVTEKSECVFFYLDAWEQVILNETVCTLENWNKIPVAC